MDSFTATILVFVVGLVVGGGLAMLFSPARRNSKRLEKERDEALSALTSHRAEVDNHFLRTAELVNNMTAAYREVHEHLSDGARVLCSETGRRLAASKSLDSLPGDNKEPDTGPVEQPLDYAPSAQGTLAEDFGLRENDKYHAEGPFTPVDDLLEPKNPAEEPMEDTLTPPRDYAEGCEDQGCSNIDVDKPDIEKKKTA